MWASDDRADRCEVSDQVERSRHMKTPMSEQAQLESYPRKNIQPVQHGTIRISFLVLLVRGNSRIKRSAARRTRDTTEESVAVIQSRQNQCSNQGVRRILSERPTDRSELTNVKEARLCQPGDMTRVIQGRINVSTEIANSGGRFYWNAFDDDRVEGASSQAASRAQPDELRFRCI